MKDIFGNALLDYYNNTYSEDIITWTNISEKDTLPLPYLFRNFKGMPKLEQKALSLAKGTILDVGCGAGSHSLWLQKQGFNVTAIDSSAGAVTVTKQRGVTSCMHQTLLQTTGRFDTIYLLMNGTGIFETIAKMPTYLNQLKSLLKDNGKIYIDSTDISYMYSSIPLKKLENYYGELDYAISYKGDTEQCLTWLYLDFDTLKHLAKLNGFTCKKIADGSHYDYLAELGI